MSPYTKLRLLLKGLDSAIVDCGNAMYWNSHEDNVRVHFEMLYFYICGLFVFSRLKCFLCTCSIWRHPAERAEESQDQYYRFGSF